MIQGALQLRQGMRVAEVGNLQRFLLTQGITDYQDLPLKVDEDFGGRTHFALQCWQKRNSVPTTGALDAGSRIVALRQGFIPFVQAVSCNVLYPNKRQVGRIVIHTMENSELDVYQAENVAAWFANKSAPRFPAPKASAHYCVDRDSIVQCVRDSDVAWHCPGVNHDGIGIELAGRAKQSPADWQDETSQAILRKAAKLCAVLCKDHLISVRKLSLDEILTPMERGFLGHMDATRAFNTPGGHQDPGSHFDWRFFLGLVRDFLK